MTILFQESEFVISMPDNLDQIAKWLEYSNKRRTTNYGLNNAVVFLDEVTLVSVLCLNSLKASEAFKCSNLKIVILIPFIKGKASLPLKLNALDLRSVQGLTVH